MDERRLTIDTGILLATNMGPTETDPALPDRHSMPLGPRAQARRCAGRVPWPVIVALALIATAVVWYSRRDDATVADPRDARARFEADRAAGYALQQQGRAAESIVLYERALNAVDDVDTRVNLANALKSVGRVTEASREFQRVLRVDPRHADAWYNYGNLLYASMKDPRGAAEAWRKATELDPNLGEAHFALGTVLLESGDFTAAIAALEAALQVGAPNAPWRADADNALTLAHLRDAEKRGVLPPPRK